MARHNKAVSRSRAGARENKSGNAMAPAKASSGRVKAVADGVKKFASDIARDVKMGASAGVLSSRKKQTENLARKNYTQEQIKDYFARTDATINRNEAQKNLRRKNNSKKKRRGVPPSPPNVTPIPPQEGIGTLPIPPQDGIGTLPIIRDDFGMPIMPQPVPFEDVSAVFTRDDFGGIRSGPVTYTGPPTYIPPVFGDRVYHFTPPPAFQPLQFGQTFDPMPPPAFQPLQFGQTFDPMPPPAFQPLQFAAEGGAINSRQRTEFPGGGLASFLTSNMDEIEDNVLAFGRPAGINSMGEVANRMAQMGRGGDNFVVHASEREMMVPREVVENNPDLRRQIMESIAAEGGDPQAYIVGNDANSINPMTGQREFFLKKLIRGIKKVFKKIAPIVLPIALAFTPLGPIYGAALGSGIGTLVQGGSVKDAFKAAAISGLTAGVFKGVTGSEGSFGANVKAGLSDPLGRLGQTASGLGSTVTGGGFTGSGNLFTPYAAPVPAAAPAPVTSTGVETGGADRSFFDKTKDFFIKPDAAPEAIAKETARIVELNKAAGAPISVSAAREIATKSLNPSVFAKYGNLALAGTALAAAGGAFTPPKPPDLTKLGYQPPTQEEIDANRIYLDGVPNPIQYSLGDLLIAPPTQFNPEDLLSGPSLTPPPAFQPIQSANAGSQNFMQQGQMQGGQNFGVDRFGNPIQSIYAAAEGGAINDFPRRSGFINGPGTEKSDSIPAMLSDGEFVMTARAVRGLGDGSREKGVRKMYDMMRMFEGGAVA
jgi:hypothetical protein